MRLIRQEADDECRATVTAAIERRFATVRLQFAGFVAVSASFIYLRSAIGQSYATV
ncbi:hypothetical protein [Larkinella knui]